MNMVGQHVTQVLRRVRQCRTRTPRWQPSFSHDSSYTFFPPYKASWYSFSCRVQHPSTPFSCQRGTYELETYICGCLFSHSINVPLQAFGNLKDIVARPCSLVLQLGAQSFLPMYRTNVTARWNSSLSQSSSSTEKNIAARLVLARIILRLSRSVP